MIAVDSDYCCIIAGIRTLSAAYNRVTGSGSYGSLFVCIVNKAGDCCGNGNRQSVDRQRSGNEADIVVRSADA